MKASEVFAGCEATGVIAGVYLEELPPEAARNGMLYTGVTFYPGALGGAYRNCIFVRCRFAPRNYCGAAEIDFGECVFVSCEFEWQQWTGRMMRSSLIDSKVHNCDFNALVAHGCRLYGVRMRQVSLPHCKTWLRAAVLAAARLEWSVPEVQEFPAGDSSGWALGPRVKELLRDAEWRAGCHPACARESFGLAQRLDLHRFVSGAGLVLESAGGMDD